MSRPTAQERRSHDEFLKRQLANENRYSVLYYRYLAKVAKNAREYILRYGVQFTSTNLADILEDEMLLDIFRKLYLDVAIKEAIYQMDYFDRKESKSILDDIVGMFVGTPKGGLVRLWRGVVRSYIEVQVLSSIAEINKTTVKRILTLLNRAEEEGLGIESTARLIVEDVGYMRYRARMIARTETVSAGNQGKFMAAKSSVNVMAKSWIPTVDKRTRYSHRHMEDSDFIDLDMPFVLTDEDGSSELASYPGDENLSAEERINCRCSVVFRAKRDPSGRLLRR